MAELNAQVRWHWTLACDPSLMLCNHAPSPDAHVDKHKRFSIVAVTSRGVM